MPGPVDLIIFEHDLQIVLGYEGLFEALGLGLAVAEERNVLSLHAWKLKV